MGGAVTAGEAIVALALARVGDRYVLGTRAPYTDRSYTGPWDCAELATWAVYQATGLLVGVTRAGDAYSGAWASGPWPAGVRVIYPYEAAGTPGAVLARAPSAPGSSGHVAIVRDVRGGTVEAYNTLHGVITSSAVGRRWTCAVLPPGVERLEPVAIQTPSVLRFGSRGASVETLQRALAARGYDVGDVDGIYGHRTATAVLALQRAAHVVTDGEVGPVTRALLGLR